jgi:hypothetical protein
MDACLGNFDVKQGGPRMRKDLRSSLSILSAPSVMTECADTQVLSRGLNGRVYEKTQIETKTYRVLDAFSVSVARLQMWQAMPKDPKPPRLPPSAMAA